MEYVDIKKIQPDLNQPRKLFDATKMRSLLVSIRQHGIKEPITIMDNEDGSYLIIEGERRYRTALDLKFSQVPANIVPPMSELERRIIQINLQKERASWSPVETAIAVSTVAELLGDTIGAVCDVLQYTEYETKVFKSFSELIDKDNFVRSEVPIDKAPYIRSLVNTAKKVYFDTLEEKFSKEDIQKLESAIIRSIKNGDIKAKKDITKLKDSFVKNPKLIAKFIKDESATPDSLFIEAKAKGAYYLRGMVQESSNLVNSARRYIENLDVKPSSEQLNRIKSAYEALSKVISLTE